MSRLFDRERFVASTLPLPFDAPRAHLALAAVWVRWRLLALAARRGEDLSRLLAMLDLGEESYQLGDEPIRAVELLERRVARLRTEIDARLATSPRLPALALQLAPEDRHAIAMLMVLEIDPACHQAAITHRRDPPGHPTLLVVEDVLSTSVRRSSLAQRTLARTSMTGIRRRRSDQAHARRAGAAVPVRRSQCPPRADKFRDVPDARPHECRRSTTRSTGDRRVARRLR